MSKLKNKTYKRKTGADPENILNGALLKAVFDKGTGTVYSYVPCR